jgi:hypothetical protein
LSFSVFSELTQIWWLSPFNAFGQRFVRGQETRAQQWRDGALVAWVASRGFVRDNGTAESLAHRHGDTVEEALGDEFAALDIVFDTLLAGTWRSPSGEVVIE